MKKIFLLIAFAVCTTVAANAQLKYENGKLRFNVSAANTNIGSTAATVWQGTEHLFVRDDGSYTSIYIAANRIYYTSSCRAAQFDTNGGLMDLYVRDIYNHSDARAKTDIRSINNATNTILKLKPVTYRFANETDYKSNSRVVASDGRESGFLAQDVMQVLPNSVTVTEDDRYLVNYISMIPILVGAIQEQNAQIEALKAEVAALKSK